MAAARKPNRLQAMVLGLLGLDHVWQAEGSGVAESSAGQMVSTHGVLTLSAAWGCTRLIAETIATLPLSLYEKTPAGPQKAGMHPLQLAISSRPNADATAAVFWEAVVASMLLRGRAPIEKLMIGGRIVGLQFLNPDRLTKSRMPDGSAGQMYNDPDKGRRLIPQSRIWTIPGFSLDGKNGVSVIQYGANVFGAAMAADQAAGTTFKNGLMPRTWFKYPQGLKDNQREDARELITGRLAGAVNAGRPAILEHGMEVGTIGINPDDAQLLESRGFSVEEVCRWFRVPPFMVGHSEKSTSWGSGIEQQMIGFLTFTLQPWLKRIEQSISKDLLAPAEALRYYPKYNVEGLLRADSAARAAFYSQMVNNGIFTRDDCRGKEELPPMGGNAAVLTVQSAMVPLDQLGASTDADATRNALRAFLGMADTPHPATQPPGQD